MTVAQNYHTSEMRCVLPVRVGRSAPTKGPNAYFLELGRNDHLLECYAAEEDFFDDLR